MGAKSICTCEKELLKNYKHDRIFRACSNPTQIDFVQSGKVDPERESTNQDAPGKDSDYNSISIEEEAQIYGMCYTKSIPNLLISFLVRPTNSWAKTGSLSCKIFGKCFLSLA